MKFLHCVKVNGIILFVVNFYALKNIVIEGMMEISLFTQVPAAIVICNQSNALSKGFILTSSIS